MPLSYWCKHDREFSFDELLSVLLDELVEELGIRDHSFSFVWTDVGALSESPNSTIR